MVTKICKKCEIEKEEHLFYRERRDFVWYYFNTCKLCYNSIKNSSSKKYREKNKDILSKQKAAWYKKNKIKIIERTSNYKKNNREKYNLNARQKRINDPNYKLRDNIRCMIRQMILKNYGNKNGSSISNFLPYSIPELKDHIEKQFEPWITWSNCGRYNSKTWDDNDQSTWKWQLDHIIPQSKLSYSNMYDENFKKCWALDNLRPLSAKQNISEGNRR